MPAEPLDTAITTHAPGVTSLIAWRCGGPPIWTGLSPSQRR